MLIKVRGGFFFRIIVQGLSEDSEVCPLGVK